MKLFKNLSVTIDIIDKHIQFEQTINGTLDTIKEQDAKKQNFVRVVAVLQGPRLQGENQEAGHGGVHGQEEGGIQSQGKEDNC